MYYIFSIQPALPKKNLISSSGACYPLFWLLCFCCLSKAVHTHAEKSLPISCSGHEVHICISTARCSTAHLILPVALPWMHKQQFPGLLNKQVLQQILWLSSQSCSLSSGEETWKHLQLPQCFFLRYLNKTVTC